MIPIRKTAAILSLVLCGGLVPRVLAQFDSASPRPSHDKQAKEQPGFVGPKGLSEEARRSFTEIPPSAPQEEETGPDPYESPFSDGEMIPSPPTRPQRRPEYILEPPDLVIVEVLEALPGRPISGERLIRPDGRISLGFYGEIPAAGLTLTQLKERIVLHLRKYLNDETLALLEYDDDGGIKNDAHGRVVVRDPRETDRVFVDVTAYNSQAYYVLGDVQFPGRLSYTGGDTVLDALQFAGGLIPWADTSKIRLIRSFPKGSPARVLPIDYDEITGGTDSSTNYALLPYDRIFVPRKPSRPTGNVGEVPRTGDAAPRRDVQAARSSAPESAPRLYFNRPVDVVSPNKFDELKDRIDNLEQKVDRLVQMMELEQLKAAGAVVEVPVAEPVPPSPPADMDAFGNREQPSHLTPDPRPKAPGPKHPSPRGNNPRSAKHGRRELVPIPQLPDDDVASPFDGGQPVPEGDPAPR